MNAPERLAKLSSDETEALLRMSKTGPFAPGICIFSLGDPVQGFHFVTKGLIEEFRLTESGEKLPMNRVGPGEIFGLSAVSGCYCCFAEAVEESVVGFLSFEALEELCRRFPKVAVNLVQVLVRRLGEVEDRLELMTFSHLRARVARALLRLHSIHGPQLRGITHETLASWAGSSRPKVSLVLGELQRAGLLQLSRGEIEIRDPAGLESWATKVSEP